MNKSSEEMDSQDEELPSSWKSVVELLLQTLFVQPFSTFPLSTVNIGTGDGAVIVADDDDEDDEFFFTEMVVSALPRLK